MNDALKQNLIFVFLRDARDDHSSVVADTGEDPRIRRAPLDAVNAFLMLLDGFQQSVLQMRFLVLVLEVDFVVVIVRRLFGCQR